MHYTERCLNWIVFAGSIFYCMYCFWKVSAKYKPYLDDEDFEPGWKILKRDRDNADSEWKNIRIVFAKYWPYIIGHLILSSLVRQAFRSVIITNCFYISYTVTMLTIAFGFKLTSWFLANVTVNIVSCYLGFKWGPFIIICILMRNMNAVIAGLNIHKYLFVVSLLWLNGRCISFTSDIINRGTNKKMTLKDVIFVFAFSLYFPTMFIGPLLYFDDFETCVVESVNQRITLKKISNFLLQIVRYVSIYLVYVFLLHFIYTSTLSYYADLTEQLDAWSLCGLGFMLPLNFFLKYKLIYGTSCLIGSFDDVDIPEPPKCIARSHTSTILWKSFDRGLHLWLVRYIYLPVIGFFRNWKINKILGCALSFGFVSLWHEVTPSVSAWCFINFLCVSIEAFVSENHRSLLGYFNYAPSEDAHRRLEGIIGSVAFLFMCTSNIFFLSNWSVGVIFLKRFALGFPVPLIPALLIFYCGCQVSIDTRLKPNKEKLK